MRDTWGWGIHGCGLCAEIYVQSEGIHESVIMERIYTRRGVTGGVRYTDVGWVNPQEAYARRVNIHGDRDLRVPPYISPLPCIYSPSLSFPSQCVPCFRM